MATITHTRLVLTRGVNDRVADNTPFAKLVTRSIKRFFRGDWGEVDPSDRAANDADAKALRAGEWGRVLAVYGTDDDKIWIIGEPGITTVLFPSEY